MKAFLAVVLIGLSSIGAAAATFTISPSGDDAADGSPEKPFATLPRARQAAREALARGENVEVILRGGTYELKEPLLFGPEDSGTSERPAVWRAAGSEEVRISGGRTATAAKVTDPAILDKVGESERPRLLQISLSEMGLSDFGEMGGGFAKSSSTGLEVFVDDRPTHPARYPNQGFITISEAPGPTPVDVRGTKGAKEGILRITDPRVAGWAEEKDGRALGYWFWDWAEEHQKIESIDATTLTLTLKKPWHGMGYRKNQYFYAYHLLSELDQPGEWFLDRGRSMLYLSPPTDNPQHIFVTVLPSILDLEKVSHFQLRGLILEGARGHALTMRDCEKVTLTNSVLRNSGKWAVQISGGKQITVQSCNIYGTGEGGVALQGGDRRNLIPAHHLIQNCRIHDYARWSRTYQPGIRLEGVGSRAAHNLIYNAPHQAIGLAGNDHRIEFNEIHHVCQESNDAGAIYAWNDWAGRGNIISGNYLHSITGQDGKGAHGVYLDDAFSSAVISGNIFKSVAGAMLLGGGRDHWVKDNLFVDCQRSIQIDARGLDWRAYGFAELKEKLEQWPFRSPPWSDRYPELPRILEEDPMAPRGVLVSRNILIDSGKIEIQEKAKPWVKVEKNLEEAPASLLLPGDAGMPRIDSGSPAVSALGFIATAVEKIGPRQR